MQPTKELSIVLAAGFTLLFGVCQLHGIVFFETGDPSYQIITKETGVEAIRIPNYPVITTDSNARIWTTWNTQFYRQSAADFLKEPLEGATFVIFGVTAEGVANPVPTPSGPKFAHEVQANLLHGLIPLSSQNSSI